MKFKDLFFAMAKAKRTEFAASCGVSYYYLRDVAYGHKRVELGQADAIVAVCRGRIDLDDLPLSDAARQQRTIRETFGRWRRRAAPPAQAAMEAQP